MKLLGSNGVTTPLSMLSSEWRKPFNISIGLHVIALAFAVLAPSLFDRQPRLPEIYTVNLFTASEVAEPEAPAVKAPVTKTAEKPAARQIEPEIKKPVVSIQQSKPEVSPTVKTTIAKPISLRPVKQKIKVGKTKEEEIRDKAKLSQVVQRLKASAVQKETQEAADVAAKNAVDKLADALKTKTATATKPAVKAPGQTTSTTKSAGISGPRGTGVEPDFYMKQYLSTVYQKIHDHWVLPELQNWDNSLEAVLVINIRRDGVVTKSFFERQSTNIYFNQFVLKALKDASPLPPFPDQLKENTFEIGLRFKPGELY
jgi:colicin import membrane protein